jgi:uncharacterized protein
MKGDVIIRRTSGLPDRNCLPQLRALLGDLKAPFARGDRVGIKLHWGERGNRSFLPPAYAREIAQWLKGIGAEPFVFDTTVLYSGGRRTGALSLATAAEHGFRESLLGCPVVVADGLDGRDIIDIAAGFRHFSTVQVASVFQHADGFVIFSHFKGHLAAGFGGSIKNISMGFASRAQKQRMHSDVHPTLVLEKCIRCGCCVEVCPASAVRPGDDDYPVYDEKMCIGCAQCIASCNEGALEIQWESDAQVFQEKLVETAAAVWRRIEGRTVIVNALVNITQECDCLSGENELIAPDWGFIGGHHPVTVDAASLEATGVEPFEKAHPGIPWRRQFEYAREIGFGG